MDQRALTDLDEAARLLPHAAVVASNHQQPAVPVAGSDKIDGAATVATDAPGSRNWTNRTGLGRSRKSSRSAMLPPSTGEPRASAEPAADGQPRHPPHRMSQTPGADPDACS